MDLACSKLGQLGRRGGDQMRRMMGVKALNKAESEFNQFVYDTIFSQYKNFIINLKGDKSSINITQDEVVPTVTNIIQRMNHELKFEKVVLIGTLYRWLFFYVQDKNEDKNLVPEPEDPIEYNLEFINKVITALEPSILKLGSSFDSIMGMVTQGHEESNCLQEGPMLNALVSVKVKDRQKISGQSRGGARVETLKVSKNKRGITRSSKPIKFKNKSDAIYNSTKKNIKSIKNNSPKSIERQTSVTAHGLRRRRRKRKGKRSKK
jgi:hypothetical protein